MRKPSFQWEQQRGRRGRFRGRFSSTFQEELMKRHRVKPGAEIDLTQIDPGATPGFKGKRKDADARLQELNERLEVLQESLWAEHKHKVLVVLQGMDTSGKDGTI